MSWDMDRIILRIYSACWVCRSPKTSWPILVTPLTTSATSSPKYSSRSSRVAAESSTVSWSRPEETVTGPRPILAKEIGYFQGVGQVGLAAQAQLAFVGFGRKDVGLLDEAGIRLRVILLYLLHHVLEADDPVSHATPGRFDP